jgi:hypothetical protein
MLSKVWHFRVVIEPGPAIQQCAGVHYLLSSVPEGGGERGWVGTMIEPGTCHTFIHYSGYWWPKTISGCIASKRFEGQNRRFRASEEG